MQVTEANFNQIAQQSSSVPVLLALVSSASPASEGVVDTLAGLAKEYQGRFLLGRVDIDSAPQIAAAFQVRGVPMVVAVLAGQPIPLFEGPAAAEQIRPVIDQVLQAAQQNGITGTVPVSQDEAAEADQPAGPSVPAHLAAAEEKLLSGDLDGAAAGFEAAVKQNPADADAQHGLSRARFLQRVAGHDAAAVRAAAAGPVTTNNLDMVLCAADLDLFDGQAQAAFDRLIAAVRATTGEERERVRARLVELFDVVGPEDPAVAKARRGLSMALF